MIIRLDVLVNKVSFFLICVLLLAKVATAQSYINLTLPSSVDPGGTNRPPLVIMANKDMVVLAREAIISENAHSDVQVLEIRGNKWRYLGDNGNSISKANGASLHSAARGPDGRFWVLVKSLNSVVAGINSLGLYVLQENRWKAYGPKIGDSLKQDEMLDVSDNDQLHFLPNGEPAFSYTRRSEQEIGGKEIPINSIGLIRVLGDRFVPIEGYGYAQFNKRLVYAWQQSQPWLLAVRHEVLGETSLEAFLMTGPNQDGRVVPFLVDQTNQTIAFKSFSISGDSTIAALGYSGVTLNGPPIKSKDQFIKLYKPIKDSRTFSADQIELPPDQSSLVGSIAYSPAGKLHAIKTSESKISIYEYSNDNWRVVAEQAGDDNYLYRFVSPQMYFSDDGKLIVTWGAQNPVD